MRQVQDQNYLIISEMDIPFYVSTGNRLQVLTNFRDLIWFLIFCWNSSGAIFCDDNEKIFSTQLYTVFWVLKCGTYCVEDFDSKCTPEHLYSFCSAVWWFWSTELFQIKNPAVDLIQAIS